MDLPSSIFILRLVKIKQPINISGLEILLKEDYPSIHEKWINRQLDGLRKKKFIIRTKSGQYTLTSLGLVIVPAGTNNNSSDIERALELGKRKWVN